MSYLARYYNENMLSWLEENKDVDEKKKCLRNDSYNLLVKFEERIVKLIESRRNRIIKQITQHPIKFNSLTYKSCNEIKGDLSSIHQKTHYL